MADEDGAQVFGRRFEHDIRRLKAELEALQQDLARGAITTASSSATTTPFMGPSDVGPSLSEAVFSLDDATLRPKCTPTFSSEGHISSEDSMPNIASIAAKEDNGWD